MQKESEEYGGDYWLRSAYNSYDKGVLIVTRIGDCSGIYNSVDATNCGVVPALYLQLS